MKTITDEKIHFIEYAYDSEEEYNNHLKLMINNGYELVSDYHDIYLFFGKFKKVFQ